MSFLALPKTTKRRRRGGHAELTNIDTDSVPPPSCSNSSPTPPSPPNTSYTIQLASWSRPKKPSAHQSGFRIGRGSFLPFNHSKLIHEAFIESKIFIRKLKTMNRIPQDNPEMNSPIQPPIMLSKPMLIPQSTAGTPSAPFLRCATEELNQSTNRISIELFTDFLDLTNALLLAGIGTGCAASDLQDYHETFHFPPPAEQDFSTPPPEYSNEPKPIDRFILKSNEYLFRPRGLECQILTNQQIRDLFNLLDPLKNLNQNEISRLSSPTPQAAPTPSHQSIGSLPSEYSTLALPLKLTLLSHFPVRIKGIDQIYTIKNSTSKVGSTSSTPSTSPSNPQSHYWHHNSELEDSARSNLLASDPAYWILIDKF
ncbi:uncharacterized protein MELLADRAFT_77365 [Melampsora larici-populina 98AG31]|uniref:Uncharacterized protein n=1 Tax=Melampsora larici-populina (strain 98AG31 / pathotype 3-4-7) TaxID=747676 RepID=F4RGP2_MELLP|nr:uncharacterized protein MELLADRAFT_77365 [Melampsora larici-populina 98AG31]EGG08591.1 hypothetical protein MELLADRAFT_77365 [Melampsora larici-populina 98AG31]